MILNAAPDLSPVKVVVIKSHIDNGYYTGYNGEINFTEFYNSQKAIDTTASGDVFNGGFFFDETLVPVVVHDVFAVDFLNVVAFCFLV